MGAYLSQPVTEKESGNRRDARFDGGYSAMQGWRTNMEDQHLLELNIDDRGTAVFGVFDGHGGQEVAHFVERHLVEELRATPGYGKGEFDAALRDAFVRLDQRMCTREGCKELMTYRAKEDSETEGSGGGPRENQLMALIKQQLGAKMAAAGEDQDGDGKYVITLGQGGQGGLQLTAVRDLGEGAGGMDDDDDDERGTDVTLEAPGGGGGGGGGDMDLGGGRFVGMTDPDDGPPGEVEPPSAAGCTAVVAMVTPENVLYVANAGDSRAVLSRNGVAVALSVDHKPDDEEEHSRIIAAGGGVIDGRVNGSLNLSRAIGDLEYKRNRRLPADKQIVTAVPDIRREQLTAQDEFIIVACDGIWDILENQDAVDFVRERLQRGVDTETICKEMCDRCLAPDTQGTGKGCDNMTVVVVKLNIKT